MRRRPPVTFRRWFNSQNRRRQRNVIGADSGLLAGYINAQIEPLPANLSLRFCRGVRSCFNGARKSFTSLNLFDSS
jgi:hypothetical protein